MASEDDKFEISDTPMNVKIIGLVTHSNFQRAKTFAEYFKRSWPERFPNIEIIPLFRFDWDELILTCKRLYGGKYYRIKPPVLVYINDRFLGTDEDFVHLLSRKYRINLYRDYNLQGIEEFKKKITNSEHKFVRLLIVIDDFGVGELVFELYNDVLPVTCDNFLRLCSLRKRGYTGAPVHRICKSGWVQFGGDHLEHQSQPCEGYQIPHDRRGVLSMCNDGKHRRNSTQFFVTLNPQPWMDYYYVAFGQMIDGNETLKLIENSPTYFESPMSSIIISDSLLYTFDQEIKPIDEKYFEINLCHCADNDDWSDSSSSVTTVYGALPDILDERDTRSILTKERYNAGLYCHEMDLVSHIDHTLYKSEVEVEDKALKLLAPPPSERSGNIDSMDESEEWTCPCQCTCSACASSTQTANQTTSTESNINNNTRYTIELENIFNQDLTRSSNDSVLSSNPDKSKKSYRSIHKSVKSVKIKDVTDVKSIEMLENVTSLNNASATSQKQIDGKYNKKDSSSSKISNAPKRIQTDITVAQLESTKISKEKASLNNEPLWISEQSLELTPGDNPVLENLL